LLGNLDKVLGNVLGLLGTVKNVP